MLAGFPSYPLWAICLLSFVSVSFCQRVNRNQPAWRTDQTRHQLAQVTSTSLQKVCQLSDLKRINGYLDNILVTRPVGSDNIKKVGLYIKRKLENLGYTVDVDRFTQQTIVGKKTFRNIIGTLDPSAPRRLVLACHYDSKDFRPQFDFMAATDSAFPCAAILDVAQSLSPYIANRAATNVTLQLIFFDGEEAFKDWTDTDSIYGSRHLAQLWADKLYPPYNSYNTREIHRIDLLVLLDLLGAEGSIPNYAPSNDARMYNALWETESSLRNTQNCLDITRPALLSGHLEAYPVQDDHIPFLKKGVPCMHMIPGQFPSVWHTRADNRSALDSGSMLNVAAIVRTFTVQYLHIRI